MLRFLTLCIFLNIQLYASWDELASVPVLSNGRFRPLSAEAKLAEKPLNVFFTEESDKLLIVPNSKDPSLWLTLTDPKVPASIKKAYFEILKADKASINTATHELASLLKEGYTPLAGHAYYPGLNYPTALQLQVEVIYYQYPWILFVLILYALGILSAIYSRSISLIFVAGGFGIHTLILALRCFILNRPPVANMYETLLYVPWVAVLFGILFAWGLRNRFILIGSTAGAGILLSLLQITGQTNSLENVQAVLNSQYWLIVHVLMVVGSYGVFLISAFFAHLYLLKKPIPITWILYSLYAGVALLIPGTILGGVWAAESWGRFWDWDPKESWAFISSCVYLLFIHAYRYKMIGPFGLAVGSLIGFQAITFTWYGVNYILGVGLHSYGFGNGGELFYGFFVLSEVLFTIFAYYSNKKKFLIKS